MFKNFLSMYTIQVPGGHRRESDPLKLELHRIVSHHMALKKELEPSARALNCQTTSPDPLFIFYYIVPQKYDGTDFCLYSFNVFRE